jgi:two-component system, response regulator
VLLVEDNASDEELMLRALQMSGVHTPVVVARDGAEALARLLPVEGASPAERPALPRVVLLDLNLPKVGGLEVLRRLRAASATRLLPVVIVTSSSEERDLVAGYRLGANSYVVKPITFDDYSAVVRGLGVYWTSINAPAPVHALL